VSLSVSQPVYIKCTLSELKLVAVRSQSHTVKSANDDLTTEMNVMSEKKKKVENVAEKTGDAIGKGIRKSAKAVNDFGKGLKKGLKKEDKKD
jgi:hypothetical protein